MLARVRALALIAAMVTYGAAALWAAITSPNSADLAVLLSSGAAILSGKPPYDLTDAHNLNAPASLPLFHFMAAINVPWLPSAWAVTSLAAYAVSMLIIARLFPTAVTPNRLLWAAAQGGLWITIGLGQIYAFLLLLVAVAYWAVPRQHHLIAGLCLGLLAAVKPNFIVLPLLMILAGRRRTGLFALAGAVAWCVPTALLYGPQVYLQWLRLAGGATPLALINATNSSLPSLAFRIGLAWLGLPLSAAVLATAALWAWRRQPDFYRLAPVAMLSSMLASPIAWIGYSCLLMPALLSRRWNAPMIVAAIMLLVPLWPRAFLGDGYIQVFGMANTVVYGCLAALYFPLQAPGIRRLAARTLSRRGRVTSPGSTAR